MTTIEIDQLKQIIESGLSRKYRIVEKWPYRKTIKGFHQWADHKTCKGAYLISDIYNVYYWFLLSEWKPNKYYLIIFDKDKINPIVEIHKIVEGKNGETLEWTYKPTKKDGRNDERKKYFIKSYFSTTAFISFPSLEDYSGFFDEIFSLIEVKQKAHLLDPIKPEDRHSFPEGKKVERIHITRERNREVVEKAKFLFKKNRGKLFCEMCTFDFQDKYGEIGCDFIEAHHALPLSHTEKDGRKTEVKDLMMLCSNCHRMVHRHRPWLTPLQIKTFFG